MKNEKRITVLIPNYNGASFIESTIQSILNGFDNVLIIIVDDLSTDNSIDVIKKLNIKNLKLLQRNKNGGFAASVNTGINYCIENKIEYVIVSNSDIILSNENCNEIIEKYKIFDDSLVSVLGFLEDGVEIFSENENISGFFFLLRLEIIKSIGYLDETFFMYGEEQDFFRRVVLSGNKIKQTGIKIKHLSEKSASGNLRNSWLSIRNSIYLETKQGVYPVLKKIAKLFLIINKMYTPKNTDPSLERIYRPGILKGNLFLILAIFWNILQKTGVTINAK